MTLWQTAIASLATLAGLASAIHALLNKRDPRAALGWCAICIMVPLLGAVLYTLFGVNRVRGRARRLQLQERNIPGSPHDSRGRGSDSINGPLAPIANLSASLQGWPLLQGNEVRELRNGEQAYPEMLEAIGRARSRICLSSYIFDTDASGMAFIDAMAAAVGRGVDVRVLVDGIGELYSWPRASRQLRKRSIPVMRFAPPRLFPPSIQFNLRNHRKILVVDRTTAFAGGMNIGDRHLQDRKRGPSVLDLHFRFDGPIAQQLERAFLDDWERAGGELPEMDPVEPEWRGSASCRVITDGPGEDMDKLTTVLTAAASTAQRRILVKTPYFLPPRELIGGLVSAALRGVDVSVILPANNNLPYVHWATRNMLWDLLRWGVKVFYQPGSFDHSKLFIVDDEYVQVGSANLDPRSLRLNFELAIEIFDAALTGRLADHCLAARDESLEVTLEQMDKRPLLHRFRDAFAWLFSPYL